MPDVACPCLDDQLELWQVDEKELEAFIRRVVDLLQLGGLRSRASVDALLACPRTHTLRPPMIGCRIKDSIR